VLYNRLLVSLCLILLLAGCTTLKKAAIVSSVTGGATAVASIVSGSAVPVATVAMGTAFATSALMDLKMKTEIPEMECAPANFWSLLGSLVEMGGWLLILIFVVPMILGWILPGPLEKKKKKNANT